MNHMVGYSEAKLESLSLGIGLPTGKLPKYWY